MKPNGMFKLSKQVKRLLGNISDAHLRGITKRAFIDAELSAAIKPRDSKRERNQETVNE